MHGITKFGNTANKSGNPIFLLPFSCLDLLILQRLFPDAVPLFLKQADRIPPPDLRLVVLVLAGILSHNALKLSHPVLLFIQFPLYRLQKPFFHQTPLIPAVRKETGQSGFLQIYLLDNRLPFPKVDLVLHQLFKILPGLGRIRHIIIKELTG